MKINKVGLKAFFYALILLLIPFAILGFRNFGSWLIVSDTMPDSLDVILTFAGETQRVSYSKELTARFPQAKWVLSDYKNGYERILRNDSYDMSRVFAVDTCTNTRSEANMFMQWLGSHAASIHSGGKVRVGLVSSPYHMRRIQLIMERMKGHDNYDLYYLPVPLDRYKWTPRMFRKWWRSEDVSRVVVSEAQKMAYYLFVF